MVASASPDGEAAPLDSAPVTYQTAFPWIVGVLLCAAVVLVVRVVYEAHRKHTIETTTRVAGGLVLVLGAVALALLFIPG